MAERWVPIFGYEGRYEVSNQGRIRSVARIARRGVIAHYPYRQRILYQKAHKRGGYLNVWLYDGKKRRCFRVHRIVAWHFLPEPAHAESEVNHKDGDTAHNADTNLEWKTGPANREDRNRRQGWKQPLPPAGDEEI